LTRVHVYHVCHFKQRSSCKFLPQKKQKYPNFYRLDFPSCNKSVCLLDCMKSSRTCPRHLCANLVWYQQGFELRAALSGYSV
jgi:hypothetical protein